MKMPSSGMFRHVALLGTVVSEEHKASLISVTRIGELRTTIAVTSNRRTLRRNTSVVTEGTLHNIPEDGILHSHRPENLKYYIFLNGWYVGKDNRDASYCTHLA
jgi:hypothetical protein